MTARNGVNGVGHAAARDPPLEVDRLYDGVRLVVLGGTGFLGKIFWILLLDRFPHIGKLFLMVRATKDQTPEARFFETVATSEALKPLRDKYGDGFAAFLREKVVPFDGDMARPRCGMSDALLRELKGTIDAVVNVAGVVDFNPPLDESIQANAFGARNLVALAKALGEGEAGVPLMHTSTTMVVGDRLGLIVEEDPSEHPYPRCDELGKDIWDPDREVDECLELIAQAKHRAGDAFRQSGFREQARENLRKRAEPAHGESFEQELARVKRKFVEARLVEAGLDRAKHWGWPNIYTYTKSIGEQIIARSGLPVTIVRPGSCESTHRFPFPGWNEGIGTSAPFIFLCMKGQVQFPALDVVLEFIPSDLVCFGMALSLAELLEGSHKPVYQYGVGDVNPCNASRFAELMGLYKRKSYQRRGKGNPFVNFLQAHVEAVGTSAERLDVMGPKAIARVSRQLASMLRGVAPLRPAAAALEGVAAREQKIGELLDLFAPFTTVQKGPFSAANTRAAYARLSAADRARLPWEPEKLDWADYWMTVHMPAVESRILPEMEKRMVREQKPLRAHRTLVTMLDEMAERHDLGVALSRLEADGLSRIAYRELAARAGAAAARLALAGVEKGDRVVLSGANHPDWAIAFFGVACAGATAVPLDPGMDAEPLANVVGQSGARVALVDAAVADKLASVSGLTALDMHAATAEDASLARPAVEVDPEDVASLIFTSGTTGTPKGVKLTHANFTSLVASLAPLFPLGTRDRVLSVLPLHHTFEFTCGLLLPLSGGARIAYLDELNGERLLKGLKLGKATAMVGVPALWQLLERRILSQVKAKGPVAEAIFATASELNRTLGKRFGVDAGKLLFGPVHQALGGNLRYLISGGAALPSETQKLFAGVGLPLIEGYGLTEAAPVLTVAKAKSPAGQVGKAIPGVEVRIREPDEAGVGEVLARGPNVMAGYTDEEATRAAIDDDGWLHTGDLGKLDDKGRLVIVGRLKEVIVTTTGENVYPDDLEQRLGKVEHVAELAVVGVDGASAARRRGQHQGERGGERVGCLAVPEADEAAAIERGARNERAMKALRAAIGKLHYREQPAIVHLIDAPLPRTATRKVKRSEVRATLERLHAAAEASLHGDGGTSAVRAAIGAIKNRPAETIASTATLRDELDFDSLALHELQVALESTFAAIDPVALQACRTVGDVEALVGAQRESIPPKHKAAKAIEGKDDDAVTVTLPPLVQEAGKRFIGKLQDAFYGQLMSARVTGRAYIPHNRNTIVVANHASHLDMGFVRHALGKYGEDVVSLAAQDYFFDGSPLRRAFFENLTNLKAVDRKGSLRQTERAAADVLEQGKTMLIFPEGTRSPDGDIHEFKPLVGQFALRHGVDILPIFLGGTRDAMPKGAALPTRRDIVARIGPPLCVTDLRRLTEGMTPADAAREVARLARAAVLALRDGDVLDLATAQREGEAPVSITRASIKKKEHPLVTLFAELETKFKPGKVPKPVSFYFTLGGDPMAKWTVRVDASSCEIRPGKPQGTADCVLKTSPEIFTRIVRDSYTPGPAEFLSGAIKSNDVELLMTFQKVFELG